MSDRKIDMTELANYIRIRPPDKNKLAELLVRAKGANRSMRQFALECGVNPSTLSRIVNMKISGACTDELIQKVAQNSDPESGITFEILMDANGKVPRRMTGKYTSEEFSITEKAITDILFKELVIRGYTLSMPKGKMNTMPSTTIIGQIGLCQPMQTLTMGRWSFGNLKSGIRC